MGRSATTCGHGTLDDSDARPEGPTRRSGTGAQVERTGVSVPASTTTQPSNSSNRHGAFIGTTVVPSVSTRKLPQSAASSPSFREPELVATAVRLPVRAPLPRAPSASCRRRRSRRPRARRSRRRRRSARSRGRCSARRCPRRGTRPRTRPTESRGEERERRPGGALRRGTTRQQAARRSRGGSSGGGPASSVPGGRARAAHDRSARRRADELVEVGPRAFIRSSRRARSQDARERFAFASSPSRGVYRASRRSRSARGRASTRARSPDARAREGSRGRDVPATPATRLPRGPAAPAPARPRQGDRRRARVSAGARR